jgi:hypothetical protein
VKTQAGPIAAGATNVAITALCTAGKRPTGGGVVTDPLPAGVNIVSLGPTPAGAAPTGFTVRFSNSGTAVQTVTVAAACVTP